MIQISLQGDLFWVPVEKMMLVPNLIIFASTLIGLNQIQSYG